MHITITYDHSLKKKKTLFINLPRCYRLRLLASLGIVLLMLLKIAAAKVLKARGSHKSSKLPVYQKRLDTLQVEFTYMIEHLPHLLSSDITTYRKSREQHLEAITVENAQVGNYRGRILAGA